MNIALLGKHNDTVHALSEQRIAIVKARDELQSSSKRLTELQEVKADLESSLRKERLKAKKVELENERLKENLQAKKKSKPKPQTETVQAKAPAVKVTGNKESWLAASGIPKSEWHYVDFIVSRESGWNPCAYNPGQSDCSANPSSACGLAQSLPCGKQGVYGHWTDPVANLKWMNDYVAKYGGWAGAYQFWLANSWY